MISIFEVTAAIDHLSIRSDSEVDDEAIQILRNFVIQEKAKRKENLSFKSRTINPIVTIGKENFIEKRKIIIPDSIYIDLEDAKCKRYGGVFKSLEKQIDYVNGQCDTIDLIEKYNDEILYIDNDKEV